VHRQHQHAQLGHLGVHLSNKLDAVTAFEGQVHDHDVGFAGPDGLAGRGFAVGLAAHREIRFRLEHAT
jgi:hypothetical protein